MRPNVIHLRRQSEDEQQQVGHREAEEVVIGSGVHRLVARDHHARGDVADQTGEKDHDVDHRDRQHDVQGIPAVRRVFVPEEGDDRARVVLIPICVNHCGTKPLQIVIFRGIPPGIPRVLDDPGDVRHRARDHFAPLVVFGSASDRQLEE